MTKLNRKQKGALATGGLVYLFILISPLFIHILFEDSDNIPGILNTTDVEQLGIYLFYVIVLTAIATLYLKNR